MADLVNITLSTEGWGDIINSNIDEVNGQFSSMLNADNPTGTVAIIDPDAITATSPSLTAPSANETELKTQIDNLITDLTSIRDTQVLILAALRQTGGVGILLD